MKHTKQEKIEALAMLHKLVNKGDTIYSIVRHVSKSGIQRKIDFYVFRMEKGRGVIPYYLSGYISTVLDMPCKGEGIVVNGCGMDMCFHVVYNLSASMFCPEGKYTHDGAYALKSERI